MQYIKIHNSIYTYLLYIFKILYTNIHYTFLLQWIKLLKPGIYSIVLFFLLLSIQMVKMCVSMVVISLISCNYFLYSFYVLLTFFCCCRCSLFGKCKFICFGFYLIFSLLFLIHHFIHFINKIYWVLESAFSMNPAIHSLTLSQRRSNQFRLRWRKKKSKNKPHTHNDEKEKSNTDAKRKNHYRAHIHTEYI